MFKGKAPVRGFSFEDATCRERTRRPGRNAIEHDGRFGSRYRRAMRGPREVSVIGVTALVQAML